MKTDANDILREDGPDRLRAVFDTSIAIRNGKAPPPKMGLSADPFYWRDPRTIPRRQWLWGSHLIRKFVSATIAPGGVGKTALGLVEAIAMVTGRDLLRNGHRGAPLRVWVYNLEDPLEEIERRVAAICLHYKICDDDLGGRLFLNSGRDNEVIIASATKTGVQIAEPVVQNICAEMTGKKIDVLIVDPFVSAHRVPENDNMAIDAVAKTFAKIADRTNAAIDLVHHVRKGNGGDVTVEDGRGAVALLAAARSARVLNVMSKEDGERAGVQRPRSYFKVENGKANLAPPPDQATWFRFVSVSLGNGDSHGILNDNSDHIGVVEPWTWPNAFDEVTVDDLRAIQDKVAAGRYRQSAQSPDWVGKAVAEILGLDTDNQMHRAKIKKLLSVWTGNRMFKSEDESDENRKMRTFVKVDEWATA